MRISASTRSQQLSWQLSCACCEMECHTLEPRLRRNSARDGFACVLPNVRRASRLRAGPCCGARARLRVCPQKLHDQHTMSLRRLVSMRACDHATTVPTPAALCFRCRASCTPCSCTRTALPRTPVRARATRYRAFRMLELHSLHGPGEPTEPREGAARAAPPRACCRKSDAWLARCGHRGARMLGAASARTPARRGPQENK
jgi:hypothetical protein